MWRVVRAVYVVAVAVVLALLAGELALRLDRRRARRDSEAYRARNVFAYAWELHAAAESLWQKPWWRYRPGARLDLPVGGERYLVEINSLGFRTREFSPRKPPGTVRVVCVGGSTTVAGRTNEETYPALLERKLRERHPDLSLEVLNLGISGTISDYWQVRRDGLFAFEPDVVVEYRAVNDIFWRHLPRYAAAHPWRRALHRSLLLGRLFPLPADRLDALLDETHETFLRTARECASNDARYVLATFAAPDPAAAPRDFLRHLDVNLDFWNRDLPLHRYVEYEAIVARHNERLERFAREHGLELAPVHRRVRDPSLFVDICHLTPEGIEALADALLPEVGRAVIESAAWRPPSPSRSPAPRAGSRPS
jgi:lysophospholipase L1-like esterase